MASTTPSTQSQPAFLRGFATGDFDINLMGMGILYCAFLAGQLNDRNSTLTFEVVTEWTDLWIKGIARRVPAATAELIFATCAQRFSRNTRLVALLKSAGVEGDDGRSSLFRYFSSRYELLTNSLSVGGNNSNAKRPDDEARQIEELSKALEKFQLDG
ncbi:hypothetical protein HD806DRAFT_488364 [Xylariaceae sp. AK1471]|nr:hypothetical protein HD806DRAFT_488364 [Xylariaceae sp. AK1471]